MPIAHEAPHHVPTHPPEADHSELHADALS